MDNIYLEILAIVLLIIANGLFALSEFAIIASRKSRLKRMAREGNHAAARALKIHSRPESFLATIQVGITFVGTLAGVFSGLTIVHYVIPVIANIPVGFISRSAQSISFLLVVIVIAFTTVIIGELVPKYLAISRPERIASAISRPVAILIKISFLPVKILTATARGIIGLIGPKRTSERAHITEEEIDILIAEGTEKGVFDDTERAIIHSVFDFTDTTARQAMTPRTDIVGIDVNDDSEKILKLIISNEFSRYPVFEETLDRIVGMIYTKDIIDVLRHSQPIVPKDIMHKPLFVPDSMMLNTLLRTFQQKRVHAAIVLDEFGGTAGMITLEDILEEIVGEIQDEFDSDQKEFVRKSDTLAFAAGSLRVEELNDLFETGFSEEGVDTLAGMIFEKLGHPAARGEQVIIKDVKMTVLEIEGNRIKRLRIEKPPIED